MGLGTSTAASSSPHSPSEPLAAPLGEAPPSARFFSIRSSRSSSAAAAAVGEAAAAAVPLAAPSGGPLPGEGAVLTCSEKDQRALKRAYGRLIWQRSSEVGSSQCGPRMQCA